MIEGTDKDLSKIEKIFNKVLTNINELNNLKLKLGLEQGNIIVSKSKIMWKNDLQIMLKEGFIDYNDDEISLIGKLIVDAKNIDNFYKSFQLKKIHRKKIKQIEMDFVYNLNNSKFKFDNVCAFATSSVRCKSSFLFVYRSGFKSDIGDSNITCLMRSKIVSVSSSLIILRPTT